MAAFAGFAGFAGSALATGLCAAGFAAAGFFGAGFGAAFTGFFAGAGAALRTGFAGRVGLVGLRALAAAGFFAGLALVAAAFFFAAGVGLRFEIAIFFHLSRSAVACYSSKPPQQQPLENGRGSQRVAAASFNRLPRRMYTAARRGACTGSAAADEQSWNAVARLIPALLTVYKRFLSPLFGSRCRFAPSCSDYARIAIARHGAWRGGLLGLFRIGRCQPLCRGGIDPVPDTFTFRRQAAPPDHPG